jgi:hypothetical protein
MTPGFSVYYVADSPASNPVLAPKLGLTYATGIFTADVKHLNYRQFGHTVPLARVHSEFGRRIRHIVIMSAHEQVIWSNTGRVIAMMTYVQARRNGTKCQLPGDSVSRRAFVLWPLLRDDVEQAIAISVSHAHPLPTPFAFTYLRPKAVGDWEHLVDARFVSIARFIRTRFRAKQAFPDLDPRRPNQEVRAACTAGPLNRHALSLPHIHDVIGPLNTYKYARIKRAVAEVERVAEQYGAA